MSRFPAVSIETVAGVGGISSAVAEAAFAPVIFTDAGRKLVSLSHLADVIRRPVEQLEHLPLLSK